MQILDRKTAESIRLFIRWSAALMLLILLLPKDQAQAAAGTGGISVEEYGVERGGQKIYGKLYMPENTARFSAAFMRKILSDSVQSLSAAA